MDAHGKAAATSDSDHGMKFAHPRKKKYRGGSVEGAAPKANLGRMTFKKGGKVDKCHGGDVKESYASGGKIKGKGNTTVNIIMPSGSGGPSPAAAMPPRPPMPVPPPAAAAAPARPPMPAGQPMPMPVPVPMGGGAPAGGPQMPMRAKGGSVFPKMEFGSGNEKGREEKMRAYGKRAFEGEKSPEKTIKTDKSESSGNMKGLNRK
jgi:hypothetical protein